MNARDLAAGDARYRAWLRSDDRQRQCRELVTLRGKLINVRNSDGHTATTSVTAGDRDCEIMWLEELRIARL